MIQILTFLKGDKVHKGEVVGISGLMGAGRTELAMSIFGKSYGIQTFKRTFLGIVLCRSLGSHIHFD